MWKYIDMFLPCWHVVMHVALFCGFRSPYGPPSENVIIEFILWVESEPCVPCSARQAEGKARTCWPNPAEGNVRASAGKLAKRHPAKIQCAADYGALWGCRNAFVWRIINVAIHEITRLVPHCQGYASLTRRVCKDLMHAYKFVRTTLPVPLRSLTSSAFVSSPGTTPALGEVVF